MRIQAAIPIAPPRVDVDPATALADVIVTASRYEVQGRESGSQHRLSNAAMLDTPTFAEDGIRIVHRLPGAASIGVSAKPRVRGGFENEVLVLFDGVELIDPFHLRDFQALFSAFNPRTIDSIEYYTGGFPARYGNRLSGVLDIAAQDTFGSPGGELGLSTFSTSGLYHAANEANDWLISARRGNLDLILNRVNPKLGDPRYHDIFTRFGRTFASGTRLELSAFRFEDNIFLNQDEIQARSKIGNNYVWAKLEFEPDETKYLRTILSTGLIKSRRIGEAQDPERVIGTLLDSRELRMQKIQQDFEWRVTDNVQLVSGGAIQHLRMAYDTLVDIERFAVTALLDQPTRTNHSFDRHIGGNALDIHATLKIRVNDLLTIQPGLRVDLQTWHETGNKTQISPRVAFLLRPDSQTSLRFSYGDFHQPKAIHELATPDGETRFEAPQRARHWIAGIEYRTPSEIRLGVEIFHKKITRQHTRYINLFNPYMLIPEIEVDRVAINAHKGFARGVELSASGPPDNGVWTWTVNYAYNEVRDRVGGRWVPRRFDQRHTVNALSTWRLGRWTLSVASAWHTGWALTQLPLEVPVSAPIDFQPIRSNARMRDYATLDARVAYELPLGRGSLSAFAEITNIVNRTNDGGVDYEISLDSGVYSLSEVDLEQIFPLVSAVGLIWRF